MDPVVKLALGAILITIVLRLIYTARKTRSRDNQGEIQRQLERLRKKRDEE